MILNNCRETEAVGFLINIAALASFIEYCWEFDVYTFRRPYSNQTCTSFSRRLELDLVVRSFYAILTQVEDRIRFIGNVHILTRPTCTSY